MNYRNTAMCLLFGLILTLAGGCAATTSPVVAVDEHPFVALGALGVGDQSQPAPRVHRLGAGDSLGQSIYRVYLAQYIASHAESRITRAATDG